MNQALELFRRRGVTRVVYLHTDHFEPWRDGVHASHRDEVYRFAEQMDALPFAKRLSLFYRAHVPYGVNSPNYRLSSDNRLSRPDDPILFRARTPEEVRIGRETMQGLLSGRSHEVQVHIHHEGFTSSDKLYPQIRDALHGVTTPEADADRFELALQLALKAIREETGLSLERWAFVHGNWALAASDADICRIENELEILARNGCYADFTFPAGRSRCNPALAHPFAVKPVIARKAYDHKEAKAAPVRPSAGALGPGRFFIWNSPVLHPFCSLDDYSSNAVKVFGDPAATVRRWIEFSPMLGSTLYVKTHAHSMYKSYWSREAGGDGVAALARPGPRSLLENLMEIAGRAGAKFETLTAENVYNEWRTADQAQVENAITRFSRTVLKRRKAPPLQLESVHRPKEVGAPRAEDLLIPKAERTSRDALNTAMTDAFRTRIEALGENASGAYGYYAARVSKDEILNAREWELANFLHDAAADVTIHEIGAGAATFTIACAALGHSCVAFERDRKRAEAAVALARACAAIDTDIPKRLRVINDHFPSALIDGLRQSVPRSMVAATNFISSIPESQEQAMIDAVARYDMALIDLCSFRIRRNDESEREALKDRFLAAGFTTGETLLEGSGYQAMLFR